jgi:nucleoside-diphosphate-sugar epimerase
MDTLASTLAAMYGQQGKIAPVPNPENFTPIRSIRIAAATWDVAKAKAREQGKSMSELIREFLDWWLRTPGAKLPARPPVDSDASE